MELGAAGLGGCLGGPSCHHHAWWCKHPSGQGCPSLTPRPSGPWHLPRPCSHLRNTIWTLGQTLWLLSLPGTLWPRPDVSWTCYITTGPWHVWLPTPRWYRCNSSIQSHQLTWSPVHRWFPTKIERLGSLLNEPLRRRSLVQNFWA